MKNRLLTILAALAASLCFTLCTRESPSPADNPEYLSHRHIADSIATNSRNLDDLHKFLDESVALGDEVAQMCCLRELGKRYRNNSDFQSAIKYHGEGVALAKKLCDTLGIIVMLNQQGTDYRRISAMDLASDCYFEAITVANNFRGVSDRVFLKNKISALNGLGNIYMAIDHPEQAERLFREALEGERMLGNHLGMAINDANIGAIIEHRGDLDSALFYYRRSFDENTLANSAFGIALCYNHFGEINEKKGHLDSAAIYYDKAYRQLTRRSDRWHWLESGTSLARVKFLQGNVPEAKEYLASSIATAQEINSWSHLSRLYDLSAEINSSERNWKLAYDDVISAMACRDSIELEKQVSHVQAMQEDYLQEKNKAALEEERLKAETAKRNQKLVIIISAILLVLSFAVVRLLIYSLQMRSRSYEAKISVEKARQEFFTNVTHDFRTPLTVIIGQAGLIRSRGSSEEDRKSAEAIIRQGDVLMDLVGEVLDLSKVKSAIGNAEWRRGSILPLMTMTVENARLAASEKFITVNMTHSSELGETEMDFIPDFMKKTFSNLLSNAVKYTDRGGSIHVKADCKDEMFRWSVSDNGIGIPKEDMNNIFTPFFRAKSAGDKPGNGIGLAMVRQMVEAMDGSISLESEEGKGSTFTFTLPLIHFKTGKVEPYVQPAPARIDDPAIPADAVQVEKDDSEKPIVLVVEDNADIASYIGDILREDYRVTIASNGRLGFNAILEDIPDLVITDLMMPDMDGLELCRNIRASETANHIPTIIITAKDREEDRLAGIKAGADAFLVKPFNADELKLIAHNLLESRRVLRERLLAEINSTEDIKEVSGNGPESNLFLSRVTGIILQDLNSRDMSVEYLASKLFMSPSSLNRKIKGVAGISTAAYITATKISVAKKLLSTTDKSVGEISDLCGFEYQSYFNRIFKAQTGCTPAEYRSRRP